MRQLKHLRSIVVLLVIFTWSFSAFASHDPGYDKTIPFLSQIRKSHQWTKFPDFPRVEIVRKGKIDEQLVKILKLAMNSPITDNGPSLDDLNTLILRHLVVKIGAQKYAGTITELPMIISIRYQEKGSLFNRPSAVHQGTLDVEGYINYNSQTDRVSIQLIKYNDSQWVEQFGRKLGFITEYNLAFANRVAVPILENYFNRQPLKNDLLSLPIYRVPKP